MKLSEETILAPANQVLDIPVSCVEAGRWNHSSSEFSPSNRAVYSSLRARKAERVSANMAMSGSRAADQGEIWGDIAAKSERMESPSPTAAMGEMYESHSETLETFVERLRPTSDQCGVAFPKHLAGVAEALVKI